MKNQWILFASIIVLSLIQLGCRREKDVVPVPVMVDYRDALVGKYMGIRNDYSSGPPPNYDTTYTDSVIITKVASDSIYLGLVKIKLEQSTLTGGYYNTGTNYLNVRFFNDSIYSSYSSGGLGQSQSSKYWGKREQ